jgi:hypothetical protein
MTSAASTSMIAATSLRLCDQGRARKKREPIEFSFHVFDFLCVVVLNSFLHSPNEDLPRRAAFRR